MAQYKHDRFFKFYIQSLYRSKGSTLKNIQIHNDEDLEIDLMFIGDLAKQGWLEQDLGLFVGVSLSGRDSIDADSSDGDYRTL